MESTVHFRLTWTVLIIVVLLPTVHTSLSHSTGHFQHWYPQYGAGFAERLRANCSAEYEYYLTAPATPNCISCYITPVVNCLLLSTDEVGKANMASAGVMLGLLPTILAWVGSNTVETGLLATRRPMLAFLLALASPAVSPIRSFNYRDPFEILQRRDGDRERKKLSKTASMIISMLQYLVALGAVTNVALNVWDLTLRVIIVMSPETEFQPFVWALVALIIHAGGAAALMLRVRLEELQPSDMPVIRQVMEREFRPFIQHSPARLTLRIESYGFIFLSWLTSIGTVLYLSYSTFMFAGALFISLGDAEVVAGRFIISVAVCRVVLMYELSGMRMVVNLKKEGEESSNYGHARVTDSKTFLP